MESFGCWRSAKVPLECVLHESAARGTHILAVKVLDWPGMLNDEREGVAAENFHDHIHNLADEAVVESSHDHIHNLAEAVVLEGSPDDIHNLVEVVALEGVPPDIHNLVEEVALEGFPDDTHNLAGTSPVVQYRNHHGLDTSAVISAVVVR
jgi:hypothetical protein